MTLATCPECGAKNRLKAPSQAGSDVIPVCGRCGTALPWLVSATDATFSREISGSLPVLVDFWAEWCGPCRMIAPVLEEVSQVLAGRLKVVKLNVDENPQTAGLYRVQSIPMMTVFKGGTPVDTFIGAVPKGALLERLRPHLD